MIRSPRTLLPLALAVSALALPLACADGDDGGDPGNGSTGTTFPEAVPGGDSPGNDMDDGVGGIPPGGDEDEEQVPVGDNNQTLPPAQSNP